MDGVGGPGRNLAIRAARAPSTDTVTIDVVEIYIGDFVVGLVEEYHAGWAESIWEVGLRRGPVAHGVDLCLQITVNKGSGEEI